MLAYANCALFIGVEDYSAFDVSLGQPAGSSDLPGGRADAAAFFRICSDLGIPAENMRISTSPGLPPELAGAIPPECLGDATHASIVKGLEWLAERLGSSARPPGLLTYSGHGDWLEGQGLVLCPSDTSGPNLTRALPFDKIEALFAANHASASLTVVLDTCHAGAARAGAGRAAGSLTGRALSPRLPAKIPSLGDRVIAACEADQLAWRGRFSGLARGALSWAVAATLEQWTPRAEGQNVELDLAYGELLERAQSLLTALSFDQTPVLRGRPGTAKTPFFHAGPLPGDDDTSDDPTAARPVGQVDPQVKVWLSLSWYPSTSWPVVSVGASPPGGSGYNLWTEYWAVDQTFQNQLASVRPGNTLTMTPTTFAAAGAPSVFTNPTLSLWRETASAPSGAMFVYANSGTSTYYALSFNLVPGSGSAAWTGSLQWLAAAPSGGSGPPGSIVGSSTIAFTYESALPTLPHGYSWFSMTLPALIWPAAPTVVGQPSLGVSMTSLNGTYYLASNKTSTQAVNVRSSTNGTTWGSVSEATPAAGTFAPAIAPLGSTLYLVYNVGGSTGALHQVTSTDGTTWTSPVATPAQSSGAPALVTVPGRTDVLCLANQGYPSSYSNQIHTRAWTGSAWTSYSNVGTTTAASAPALGTLNGSLYLAFADTSHRIQVYRASGVSTGGITWPTSGSPIATLVPPSGSQWRSPSLSLSGNQLALSFVDGSGHLWVCFSSDGVEWSGYQDLSTQLPAIASSLAPAVASIGSTLVLGFVGTTTSANGLASLATLGTAVT